MSDTMTDQYLAKKKKTTNGSETISDEEYIYKKLKKRKRRKHQHPKDVVSDEYWEVRVPYRVFDASKRKRKYYTMSRLVDMCCPDEIPKALIVQRDKWLELAEVQIITNKPTSDPLGFKKERREAILHEAIELCQVYEFKK